MAITLEDIQNIAYNDTVNKIKIYYSQILGHPCLIRNVPNSILYTLQKQDYIYFDTLDLDTQYNIAICVFKEQNVIQFGDDGHEYIYYKYFKHDDYSSRPPELVSNVSQENMVKAFYNYAKYNENVFTLSVDWENDTSVSYTDIYMDSQEDRPQYFEIDPEQFVINAFKNFIYTPKGQLPGSPYFGTNLKQYLHTLAPNLVAQELKKELSILSNHISKIVNQNEPAVTIHVGDVKVYQSETSGSLEVVCKVAVNNVQYSIKVK